MTGNITADEGDVVEFHCKVDANPLTEDTITWDLPDHPNESIAGKDWRDRSQIILEDRTSILKLSGIERTDSGRVVCLASNGVKERVQSAVTYLIVNRKQRYFF